ncbi:MAG: carbohydrate ABC transporter permease [Caldilineaceae bacterium]
MTKAYATLKSSAPLDAVDHPTRRRWVTYATCLGTHLLIGGGALLMLLPFLWTVSTSLKLPGAALSWPPAFLPDSFHWENYIEVWSIVPFLTYFANTTIITLTSVLGNVLSSTLIGYAFARLRFPGRETLFIACLSTMMLPFVVIMIPRYILFRNLGWIDTFLPLIVPEWFGAAVFIFFSRQFFRGLPMEYDEAARIDGASSWWIWYKIILPMSTPLIASIAILAFRGSWNDFMAPLIYLQSDEHLTLALGLVKFRGYYRTEWALMMAGSTLMTIPVILVFFFFQRYFLQGITFSGLTGR